MGKFIRKIADLGAHCATAEAFKTAVKENLKQDGNRLNPDAVENLLRLIDFDGRTVFELSEERRLRLDTLTLLWKHIRREGSENVSPHFLLDLRRQFERLEDAGSMPSPGQVIKWMKRWPDGLQPRIRSLRDGNRKRIIRYLVERIERHHGRNNRYVFTPNLTQDEKVRQVEAWWNDYRFHLSLAVRSAGELNRALGNTLSASTLALYKQAARKGMPVFVTPYYLSLLSTGTDGYDDAVLRSYVLYSKELVETFGEIRAWEREDRVTPGEPNAAGWLLPEGNNIHRRYPEVIILIPDSVGRACGGLCASCQRMYDFQKGRLNFNFRELRPKETWSEKLRRLMSYVESDKQIKDILITGGDALMSQNATLRHLLDEVRKMAIRKRKANRNRPDGEKYAEIERVRLGTRLPVYLPMRVTDELVEILRTFRQEGAAAGIKQFVIQTHFQSPLEITPESKRAVRRLREAGWIVTNQLVFNVAASRRGHAAKLRRCLNTIGVVCYYTFSVKGFRENHAVFAPNSRSLQERMEEKILGRIDAGDEARLSGALLSDGGSDALRTFCSMRGIPFIASDRNVLNLPGIGKSMTFRLVGILADGRRVLEFEHDPTRQHSPVIAGLPKVYILENKPVGAYLAQLAGMGENPEEYDSIWRYTEGRTEHRFHVFEYPGTGTGFTGEINHFAAR